MKFAITLEQGEDGFIIASCPALPGCHSQGRTREEAIRAQAQRAGLRFINVSYSGHWAKQE